MKKLSLLIICLLSLQAVRAQDNNRAITTGVPFLLIPADARAAGMGDVGVATSTDAFSQQYNPAKYAFALDEQGISVSYTPYLTAIVNDISLGQVTYYSKINERSAFAGSLRYFGLGEIQLTNENGDALQTVNPNEFAIDLSYSLKLGERFSFAVAGRYIRSNLKIPDDNNDASAGNSFAVDLAGYYQSEQIAYDDFDGRWRAGFNFQNMGPKISYDNDEFSSNFLPSQMKLGGGFDFIFDEYNKLGLTVEVNKLMVPTPQKPEYIDLDGDGVISPSEISTAIPDTHPILR